MNLSLIAAVLLLVWLLMPCLLSPATFGRLWPSAPVRLEQEEQRHSAPAADILARLYRGRRLPHAAPEDRHAR
jgi:hypothetical protein